MTASIETHGPDETRALGERLGALVEPGDVVLLSGELGAGKTVFVQGIARGLGYEGRVSSKSFVLMGEYRGRVTIYHADLYRLDDPAQVEELALEEISRDGVLVVEWPERAGYPIVDEYLSLRFDVVSETGRCVSIEPCGARAEELAQALAGGD